MKPVSPRSKSGCHFQTPLRGSGGASNQPLGVTMSLRPSPFTSPTPMPWPQLLGLTMCLTNSPFLRLIPGQRHVGIAEFGKHFVGLAVVVEIHQKGELYGRAGLDHVFLPLAAGCAGVLAPEEAVREPGAAHDIDAAVAVDVERQIREVIDVVVGVRQGAEFVLDPARAFVPVLAGDDVGPAVAVDVGDGAAFVGAEIEGVLLERDVGGTGGGALPSRARTPARHRHAANRRRGGSCRDCNSGYAG